MTISKNIVLFIDGTWNRADRPRGRITNVAKLHIASAMRDGGSHIVDGVPVAQSGSPQVVHYQRGVGTGGVFDRALGGTTGFGSEERIREAYLFLAQNYKQGDRVYLFGFSRGAFAARALAGFVARVGLLFASAASRKNVGTAYELYEQWSFDKQQFISKVSRRLEIPQSALAEVAPIPVHFIGVWDTVKRLGLKLGPMHPGLSAFHDHAALPRHITHARHALALHDLRPEFEPTVWEDWSDPQSLEQVWFRGAHSDVGGGYLRTELSDISLDWMAREAIRHSLLCDASQLPGALPAAPSAAVHFASLPRVVARPFAPREVLFRGSTSTGSRLIKTFSVHATACKQLLSRFPTRFVLDDARSARDKAWRKAARHEPMLAEVDRLTLALHLDLCMNHGRLSTQ